MVIHDTSNHPTQNKHAAFNHMLHRLTKIQLSKQDNNDELNTVKYIGIKNGYNSNLINKLHKHIQKTQIQLSIQNKKYQENHINDTKKDIDKYNKTGVYKLNRCV